MKHIPCLIALVLLQLSAHAQSPLPALVPTPSSIKMQKGNFVFIERMIIKADPADSHTAGFLTRYLLSRRQIRTKLIADNVKTGNKQPVIIITGKGAEGLPPEGYRLSISSDSIKLIGKDAGLFYAIQTLLQLFPDESSKTPVLPCLTIEDQPRFSYRGLMLDVSRHFFTIAEIKDLLDWMAFYKLNRFHWHLTDDQGWRLEIKACPKLTQTGAWRVPRIEFSNNTLPPQPGEKATDGGFYTQEQVKDIIRYAADRHIEIIPEIDVPGHSMAAIASYPDLCVTRDHSIKVNPGSSFAKWFPKGGFEMYVDNTLNPMDEHVYDFLDKVFSEVSVLFPSQYIHIGGDECYKGFWERDSSVQVFMRKNDLRNSSQLQGYFISRLNKIIQSKGKKLIGWDEILEGDVSGNIMVMNRFGEKNAIGQIHKGLNIILAPGNNGFYFDYAQSTSDMEPSSHGGNAPLSKSFTFDPEYEALSAEDRKHISGIEACIWTEHISSIPKLYYMTFPRLLGLAETAWSSQSNKSYQSFADNVLPAHLERFDKQGIDYRVPAATDPVDTSIIGSSYTFIAKIPFAGAKVYFTLSNSYPSDADHLYTGPVSITIPAGKKITVSAVVITPAGRRSIITKTTITSSPPSSALSR